MLPSQSFTPNYLLSALAPDDFALLQPHLLRVELAPRHALHAANQPIEHVYFLEGGVASIVADQADGTVEVGIFGRDGMSGSAVLLGADRTPHRCFMQVDGPTALRIATERLIALRETSATLNAMLLRFAHVLFVQSAQTAVANAQYQLTERLARWLLMCHDRVDGDDIPLTHEFLGMMLAVRRSGVTVTLHVLEGSLAIRARRGVVTIRDRARLEDIAGDSYGTAEAEYRRLIGPFGKSAAMAA